MLCVYLSLSIYIYIYTCIHYVYSYLGEYTALCAAGVLSFEARRPSPAAPTHMYMCNIYIYIYIYISISLSLSLSLYIYIYIYVYFPHLGSINAPPLICVFRPNDVFTIHVLSKRQDIYKIMAKTLLTIFPPSWEDPFARIRYGTFI